MSDCINRSSFLGAGRTEDWRVAGDGMCAYFRAGSFSAGGRFVQAFGEVRDFEAHPPDVDVRADGVTVGLITMAEDWMGPSQRDVYGVHQWTERAGQRNCARYS